MLVWNKPTDYSDVADYRVYMNGVSLGSAATNNTAFSPAKPYINKFYADDTTNFHVKITVHNFSVTGLSPDTNYSFTVRSVNGAGVESVDSNVVTQRTTAVPTVVNITAAPYNAVGDGSTLNTVAIQAAIDACPVNGKVLIPAGTFRTGALFLKSNMTLEIAESATLLGSANADDYPMSKGYVLYSYMDPVANARPPSLINALDAASHTAGTFQNIRIVGKGTIDGNGWLRGISASSAASILDELGNSLPQYRASNSSKVGSDGILAKDQVAKAVAAGVALDTAYSNRRSSLITLRGVRNAYYAGFTVLNPAYHGIMNLETENVAVNGVIHKTYDANNGDGIEFGNSKNVMVFNNFMDTGDDCVNFAAGQGSGAASLPIQQTAWIFNNYFREGHGAVVTGSHTGAWIEGILAEDNVLNLTEVGLRMKSTPPTGGGGRNVIYRDTASRGIRKQGFIFTLAYTAGSNTFAAALASALFRDITIRNASVDGGNVPAIVVDGLAASGADGYAETFQENINFENVKIKNMKPTSIDRLKNSTFKNVTITNSGTTPWVITNSPGLTFTGTSPTPAGY